MPNKKISEAKAIFYLAPMIVSLAMAMDIYIPAVPHITKLMHVTPNLMQLTLTLFMVTAGVIQLLIGPVSDYLGRKIVSSFVIGLFSVGTVLCSSAHALLPLIIYRIIQAIGACGMMVIGFAIVRDLYHGIQSARVYSYLNSMMAFSPMFGPFIGSYLDVKYGWPSTFLALLVFAVLAILTVGYLLPETLPTDKRRPIELSLFKTYWQLLRNQVFLFYTLSSAFGLLYLFTFFLISPYIIITALKIPEIHYGYYFCFMGISFFLGGILSANVVSKLGVYRTTILGHAISLIGALIMLIWYLISGLTINNFIWPMLLIGVGGTFSMSTGTSGAMEPFPAQAGSAAALGGSFRFLFGGFIGMLTVGDTVNSTLPLSIPAIGFSIIGLLIFLSRKKILAFE